MKAKKLLAGVLTCTMVFAMGMTAFAADGGNVDAGMKKSYKLVNAGTKSPAETFHFTAKCTAVDGVADGVTVENAPKLTIQDAVYEENDATVGGAERILKIKHDEQLFSSVGIYTYEVTETAGSTAGVTYDTTEKTLVVTVTQEENGLKETYALHNGKAKANNKTDTVENTYSAGSLCVKKVVTGNLGDKKKEFDFTVKFTKPEGKDVKSTIKATVAGKEVDFKPVWDENRTYTYTFKLSDEASATFENLPYGVTYDVTENSDKYESSIEGKGSDKIAAPTQSVTFKNTKTGSVDTGINLTTLPYMLTIAAIFVIAAIAFVAKRRRFED